MHSGGRRQDVRPRGTGLRVLAVHVPSCTAPTSSSTSPKVEATGRANFDIGSSLIWSLLNGLSKRIITGGEAHDLVMRTMMTQSQDGADLLWRILSKDLRCGVTSKTIVKLMPGLIPTFDVNLKAL